VEIGDTIEEETSAEESPGRSSGSAGTRRKNGKNGGKGRNGKGNGNAGMKRGNEYNGGAPASDERMRDVDLRRLLSALRDLRDGEFEVRLQTFEDPLLADIADAFNGIAKLN